MSNNTQALNSVLTLAGVKNGNFSQLAANEAIQRAAYNAITAGNTRPFDDTKTAIPKGLVIDKEATAQNGGVKMFKYAANIQGVVLAALITAAADSRAYFEKIKDNQGKLNKKLNAADLELATQYAAAVAHTFNEACEKGAKALKEARNLAADKTKATKEAKAAAAEVAAAEVAAAAAIESEKRAADTLTISEFLSNIKGGNNDALALAEIIAAALAEYKQVQTSKQAAAADFKAAKASKQAAAKASHAKNRALNSEAIAQSIAA